MFLPIGTVNTMANSYPGMDATPYPPTLPLVKEYHPGNISRDLRRSNCHPSSGCSEIVSAKELAKFTLVNKVLTVATYVHRV